MDQLNLLARVLLDFKDDSEKHPSKDLSAVCRTADGHLWLASDESASIERLAPLSESRFGDHVRFDLRAFLPLPDDPDLEIDIEGLDVCDGHMWIVGSHGSKRKKTKGRDPRKDLERLATVERETDRCFLARIPLSEGKLVKETRATSGDSGPLRAAMLPFTEEGNALMSALLQDPHYKPFLAAHIPGKDNGFDIEGLCVRKNTISLGLRGPVLRGWAGLLQIEVEETARGELSLVSKRNGDAPVRKVFFDLDGLGIRDLRLRGKELFILAGPTMVLDGAIRLYRLADIDALEKPFVEQRTGVFERILEFPHGVGTDRAEGLTFFPWQGRNDTILTVYDGPRAERVCGETAVWADVWRLP